METGYITPDKKFLIMPYYEMGDYAEYVVNQFVKKSSENKLIFEDFRKDYTYFDPYFDFLVFVLNYEVINPLFIENSVGYYNKEHMVIQKVDNYIKYEKNDIEKIDHVLNINISKSDDITLGLKLFDYDDAEYSCILLMDGYSLTVDRKNNMYHDEIIKLVINNYILKNKGICENYAAKMQEASILKTGFNYRKYVLDNFGSVSIQFYPDPNKGFYSLLYAKNGVSLYINDIIEKLVSNYPGSIPGPYELSLEELTEQKKITQYLYADYYNRMKGSR